MKVPALDGLWKAKSSSVIIQISGRGPSGGGRWQSFYASSGDVNVSLEDSSAGLRCDGQGAMADGVISYSFKDEASGCVEIGTISAKNESVLARVVGEAETQFVNRFVPDVLTGVWCVVGQEDIGVRFAPPGEGETPVPDRQTAKEDVQYQVNGTSFPSVDSVHLQFNVANDSGSPQSTSKVVLAWKTTSGEQTSSGKFVGASTMVFDATANTAAWSLQRRPDAAGCKD